MMGVMIPVYILNALYLGPLTLWTYWRWGRPPKPSKLGKGGANAHDHQNHGNGNDHSTMDHSMMTQTAVNHGSMNHLTMDHAKEGHNDMNHVKVDQENTSHSHMDHDREMHEGMHPAHMHHMDAERPMFATVTVAVCHCGSGCLLGDLIGEWIVFGTHAQVNGKEIWVEFLLDYAFALIIGILFQYWSIAPMSGEYGMRTVIRAAKADFLSLTFFEIGLFGWMAIFQLAIFKSRLPMDGVVYWWMMQIGMFLGHWTSFPINWWLIKAGIKEPCA